MRVGMPAVSVILAVHNGGRWLDRALSAIGQSHFRDFELIVVDDASTDDSARIARAHAPTLLLSNARRLDADSSRNLAAARARGEILFFVDADVVIAPDTLGRVVRDMGHPDVGAVIGVYRLLREHENLASLYKNTWIRYSYLQSPATPSWFFTAAGGVRKSLFEAAGGFDPTFSTSRGGADLDFGRRLAAGGVRILLDKELEVTHLKTFSLAGLLRHDARRACGWSLLARRSGRGLLGHATTGMANVSVGFCASVVLAWSIALWAAAGAVGAAGTAAGLVLLAALHAALSARFLAYASTALSPARALAMIPILYLDHLACGLGVLAAVAGPRPAGVALPALAPAPTPAVDAPG